MKKTFITILLICMTVFLIAGEHSYKFKSGKFVTKITGPYNSISTTYFDDYGKKMYVETSMEMEMQGQVHKKKHSMLVLPENSYSIQHDKQSYMVLPQDDEYDTEEDYMAYKNDLGEKIGTEKILGRTCDIYQKDNMKFWIWKEMPLKSEITENGQKFISEVISMEENVKIPASKFELPSGYSQQAAPSFEGMNMNMEALQKSMEANEQQSKNEELRKMQDNRSKKIKPVTADKFQKSNSAKRISEQRSKRLKPVTADRFEKKTEKAAKDEAVKKAEEEKKKAVEEEDGVKEKIKTLKKIKSLF
eukprot:Anaeramoba_ignava/a360320_8.p1 GENE.a360320_8~~a360320_8.p1  ORF type:complete len:304 (+),score=47.17 a360320_8:813-1724(+)